MIVTRCLALLVVVSLCGCGPVIGQLTRLADGVKRFEFVQGSVHDLRGGGALLVLGPFDKTRDAFYICRGEDAADFADRLQDAGVFQTRLLLEPQPEPWAAAEQRLRTLSPGEIQQHYRLDAPPRWVLFGTIVHRETFIAPTRGVIMKVGYRLEFYDPLARRSTVLAVGVRAPAETTVARIVAELASRLAETVPTAQ